MMLALAAAAPLAAQNPAATPDAPNTQIVTGERPQPGPEIRGYITARSGDRMAVTAEDGTKTIITLDDATQVKGKSGLFGGKGKFGVSALMNGLPVTVKTWAAGDALVASVVTFRSSDFKTASMIRSGTAQGFEEQSAATAALRGRVADIDNYNIKRTANVYFDTAKWTLSDQAKAELCATAAEAEKTPNSLLLVVGYTDSVGDEDYNQELSEKRASRVLAHLQQVCRWKQFRTLTPSGMAESDPAADNSTEEGKAQNRRVAVNVLVSKAVDGL
ncbi:OmpA family protein [Sandarakinorhabdus sp. AAP62]|uniref:OmpA family protein n=1 Tax=Sandarakinorhabdus sp. AAP62 TaxID=1248916 RepID=UPI00035C306A|nr:OmpA family protein [Sandarakinorhabdus sp. AAP62]